MTVWQHHGATHTHTHTHTHTRLVANVYLCSLFAAAQLCEPNSCADIDDDDDDGALWLASITPCDCIQQLTLIATIISVVLSTVELHF